MKMQTLSVYDQPYQQTGIISAYVTSDHIPLEYPPLFLPEQMGSITLRHSDSMIPTVITPRVRGAPLMILGTELKEINMEEKYIQQSRGYHAWVPPPRRRNKGKKPQRLLPPRSCKKSNRRPINFVDIMPQGEIDQFNAIVYHTPRMQHRIQVGATVRAYLKRVTMYDQHLSHDPSQSDIDKAVACLPED